MRLPQKVWSSLYFTVLIFSLLFWSLPFLVFPFLNLFWSDLFFLSLPDLSSSSLIFTFSFLSLSDFYSFDLSFFAIIHIQYSILFGSVLFCFPSLVFTFPIFPFLFFIYFSLLIVRIMICTVKPCKSVVSQRISRFYIYIIPIFFACSHI